MARAKLNHARVTTNYKVPEWSIGISTSHDSNICIMKDGEVVVHLVEERFSNIKHSREVVWSLEKIKDYTRNLDYIACTTLYDMVMDPEFGYVDMTLIKEGIKLNNFVNCSRLHHELHAICGLVNSEFDDAVCVIIDGAGSDYTYYTKENETILDIDSDLNTTVLHKTVIGTKEDTEYPYRKGIGMAYNAVTEYIGFDSNEEGKTMGLSAYGKPNPFLKDLVTFEHGASDECFTTKVIAHAGIVGFDFDYENCTTGRLKLPKEDPSWKVKKDLAYKIQSDFEEYVYQKVMLALSLSKNRNVVLSGGCFMNCVSNYKLLKRLPEDVKVFVDPMATDVGISIGVAYRTQSHLKQPIKRHSSPAYLGEPLTYDYNLKDGQTERDTTPEEVANLLANGNIVAIAQGRGETAPRALGNRSILFDPRIEDGKEIVNRVKKREPWRPFAGTVMLEHAREWFDMDRLDESPYMTYAVDVLPDKQESIPSITHVDGTCRIQTVTEEQNEHYYNLISEFNKLTGVPIVFNTSFNLGGDTMVNSMEDALDTLERSDIEYLYLPEIMKLVHVPNENRFR